MCQPRSDHPAGAFLMRFFEIVRKSFFASLSNFVVYTLDNLSYIFLTSRSRLTSPMAQRNGIGGNHRTSIQSQEGDAKRKGEGNDQGTVRSAG
jgi:hypothetical protein